MRQKDERGRGTLQVDYKHLRIADATGVTEPRSATTQ